MSDTTQHLLRTIEVAQRLGVTSGVVRRLIQNRELRALRIGSHTIRVRREDLEKFIARNLTPEGDTEE